MVENDYQVQLFGTLAKRKISFQTANSKLKSMDIFKHTRFLPKLSNDIQFVENSIILDAESKANVNNRNNADTKLVVYWNDEGHFSQLIGTSTSKDHEHRNVEKDDLFVPVVTLKLPPGTNCRVNNLNFQTSDKRIIFMITPSSQFGKYRVFEKRRIPISGE